MVEYHVEYILCVVSSDDSEIQQAYDRETDSILAMPIVSFFTTDKAQKVLVAIGVPGNNREHVVFWGIPKMYFFAALSFFLGT